MSLIPNTAQFELHSRRPAVARARPRPFAAVGWRYSSILVVALMLLSLFRFTSLGPDSGGERTVSFRVTDGATGASLSGATVELGGARAVTDSNGVARFVTGWQDQQALVSVDGYAGMALEIGKESDEDHSIALQPVGGNDAVAAVAQETESGESESEDTADPTPTEMSAETPIAVATVQVTPTVEDGMALTGTVLSKNGRVIAGTYARLDQQVAEVDDEGRFSLSGAEIGDTIEISAPGFDDVFIEIADEAPISVTLRAREIRGVYLSGAQVGDPAVIRSILRLAERTQINAVVIDVKEYVVFYDTEVEFFRDADMVIDAYDPTKLVKRFKDAGLYTIARQVVFKDPLVAEAYPELAVKNEETGDLWRGNEGEAWVNPFHEELWQPNIDLGLEAAGFGFDEIQYDYIRFPSDGDLTVADFGPDYTEEGRVGAIVAFLKESQAAFRQVGVKFAVDVFGVAAIFDNDQGIGQRIADMAPYVDYICPMIYPSHFTPGVFGFDQEPNALPYETIEMSLSWAREKIPGQEHKLRPWLQDFTWGEPEYGPEEVRAQIDATEEVIGYGYLLWNANVEYTEGALTPD